MNHSSLESPENSSSSPFGDDDASRSQSVESIDKVGSRGFVKIRISGVGGINNSGDNRYRVIVGKKGSGKTLYLRRSYIKLLEYATYKEDFGDVLEYLKQTRPQTQLILRFSQYFNGEFLTEKWRELWRRAIIRALITHILYGDSDGSRDSLRSLRQSLPKDFKNKYKSILSKASTPISIFSQVIEIIESINNGDDFNKFCNNILWAELDSTLGPIIKESKPLYFYVDAIDEEYQHAPMYWMRAQKGLFYSVMQFLRDVDYGGKLHVIISIRDHVYSSVLQSEHKSRYLNSEHITILKWNPKSALFLIEEKLKVLDSIYLVNEGEKNIYNWIGLKEIRNEVLNISESIIDYLVRHTRALPRDLIKLGNTISDTILKYKLTNKSFEDFEVVIRGIVNKLAWDFGDEQLTIASNHLTSNLTPSEAFELGIDEMFTSSYTGIEEYLNLSQHYKNLICDILKNIGKDHLSYDEMEQAKVDAKKKFNSDTDLYLFDILWQNGLIGYEQDDCCIFYDEMSTEFTLPEKEKYVFPSILIDRLDLSPVGKPVYLNYRNDE